MVLAILVGIVIVGLFITLWQIIAKSKITKKKQDEFDIE